MRPARHRRLRLLLLAAAVCALSLGALRAGQDFDPAQATAGLADPLSLDDFLSRSPSRESEDVPQSVTPYARRSLRGLSHEEIDRTMGPSGREESAGRVEGPTPRSTSLEICETLVWSLPPRDAAVALAWKFLDPADRAGVRFVIALRGIDVRPNRLHSSPSCRHRCQKTCVRCPPVPSSVSPGRWQAS